MDKEDSMEKLGKQPIVRLKYVYYPDHDKRYAHIPAGQRHEYPDEVIALDTGETVKRLYTKEEVDNMSESEQVDYLFQRFPPGLDYIFMRDIPMSEVFERANQLYQNSKLWPVLAVVVPS